MKYRYIQGFPDKLKKLIEYHSMSINHIATQLDCSVSTIYNWMNGVTIPTAYELKMLCEILDTSADYLLFD